MNKKILMYHQLNQNAEAVWVTEWALLTVTLSELTPPPACTSPRHADLMESVYTEAYMPWLVSLLRTQLFSFWKKCKL